MQFSELCGPGDITAAAAAAAEDVQDILEPHAAVATLVAATKPPVLEEFDCYGTDMQDEEGYGAAPLSAATFGSNDRAFAPAGLDQAINAGCETDLQERIWRVPTRRCTGEEGDGTQEVLPRTTTTLVVLKTSRTTLW